MDEFDMEAFFASNEFNSLDDENKEHLREFAQKSAGKSQADALAVFMAYRGKLKIDADKQKQLIDALKTGLSPDNRKKLELMEMLMNRGGK